MKGIVLVSHGGLAEGMLDTLKMFAGEVEQIEAISLKAEENLEHFYERLKQAVNKVNDGSGVVIFSDLLFGTPSNISARFYKNASQPEMIDLISGMNLPLLLEFTTLRNKRFDIKGLVEIGKDGIRDYGAMLEQQ